MVLCKARIDKRPIAIEINILTLLILEAARIVSVRLVILAKHGNARRRSLLKWHVMARVSHGCGGVALKIDLFSALQKSVGFRLDSKKKELVFDWEAKPMLVLALQLAPR